MVNQILPPEQDNIPVVVYQNVRVITTELLADKFGTSPTNIRTNYSSNVTRFERGKHYFLLDGKVLKEFKDLQNELQHRVSDLDSVSVVSPNASSLMLWTERGAARHAKMLNTDKAWDVFEQLEEHYFNPQTAPKQVAQSSTIKDPTLAIMAQINDLVQRTIVEIDGVKQEQIRLSEEQRQIAESHEKLATSHAAVKDAYKKTTTDVYNRIKKQEQILSRRDPAKKHNVRHIGSVLGISAQAVNRLLEQIGLQGNRKESRLADFDSRTALWSSESSDLRQYWISMPCFDFLV